MIEIIKSDSEPECKIGDLRNCGIVTKIESVNFCWGRQYTFYKNEKPWCYIADSVKECGFKSLQSFLDTMKKKHGKQWYGYAITIN